MAECAANSGQHAFFTHQRSPSRPHRAHPCRLRPDFSSLVVFSCFLIQAPSSLAMSSVDAASPPAQTVTSPASLAEQPPSHPEASGPQEPLRDADTLSTTSEIEPRVEAARAEGDGNAPQVVEGSPSPGEVLAAVGSEQVEGMDAEQGAGVVDDSQQWAEEDSHELKRVKVYELMGSRWVDQGTAFCFGDFQDNEALLIARAEDDFNRIILTTTIRATDVYQRQQGT